MPGAYEVFGCPPTKKIFLHTNSCRKILPRFFLLFPQITSHENSDDLFFSHFSQCLLFLSEHLSGCPIILDARGRSSLFTHLPLLFRHLPMHFFRKLCRWMPPG